MSPQRKINEVKTKQNINVQWSQMCEHVEAKVRRKTIKRGYLVFILGWFLLFALDNYPIPCPHHITWFSVYRVTHDAPHDPCIILFFLCNILIWSWVTLSFSLSLHHTQCNAWRVEIGGWDSCSITLQYLFSFFFFFSVSFLLRSVYMVFFFIVVTLTGYSILKFIFILFCFFFHADATYDISWSVTVLRIFINIIYERVCVWF